MAEERAAHENRRSARPPLAARELRHLAGGTRNSPALSPPRGTAFSGSVAREGRLGFRSAGGGWNRAGPLERSPQTPLPEGGPRPKKRKRSGEYRRTPASTRDSGRPQQRPCRLRGRSFADGASRTGLRGCLPAPSPNPPPSRRIRNRNAYCVGPERRSDPIHPGRPPRSPRSSRRGGCQYYPPYAPTH